MCHAKIPERMAGPRVYPRTNNKHSRKVLGFLLSPKYIHSMGATYFVANKLVCRLVLMCLNVLCLDWSVEKFDLKKCRIASFSSRKLPYCNLQDVAKIHPFGRARFHRGCKRGVAPQDFRLRANDEILGLCAWERGHLACKRRGAAPSAGGMPVLRGAVSRRRSWIPACAGMTRLRFAYFKV